MSAGGIRYLYGQQHQAIKTFYRAMWGFQRNFMRFMEKMRGALVVKLPLLKTKLDEHFLLFQRKKKKKILLKIQNSC